MWNSECSEPPGPHGRPGPQEPGPLVPSRSWCSARQSVGCQSAERAGDWQCFLIECMIQHECIYDNTIKFIHRWIFFFCNMSHVWLSCTKDFCIQILLSMRYTSFSDNFKLAVEVRDRSTGWQNLLWSVYPRKTSPSVLPTGSDTKLPCWPSFYWDHSVPPCWQPDPNASWGKAPLAKLLHFYEIDTWGKVIPFLKIFI